MEPSHIVVKPFKSFGKTNLPISAKILGYDLNMFFSPKNIWLSWIYRISISRKPAERSASFIKDFNSLGLGNHKRFLINQKLADIRTQIKYFPRSKKILITCTFHILNYTLHNSHIIYITSELGMGSPEIKINALFMIYFEWM